MGFNTVAVLYNDHTYAFRQDGALGQRIATAMTAGWSERHRNKLATWFGAGQIVSQAHADYSQIVVCGRNTGAPLSECNELDWFALHQLAEALRRHGYTVKPPRKSKWKTAA